MLTRVKIETGIVEGLPAADQRVNPLKEFLLRLRCGKTLESAADREKVGAASFTRTNSPISMQHKAGRGPRECLYMRVDTNPDIWMAEDSAIKTYGHRRKADEKLPFSSGNSAVAFRGNTAEMNLTASA
jgi:hypothetical protein